MSSSASLEAATLIALEGLGGFSMPKLEEARLCQRAENDWVGVNCGILDQYTSILGEAGHAMLLDCRELTHELARIPETLDLVIADTCVPRELAGSEYDARRAECERAARLLSDILPDVRSLRDVAPAQLARHQHRLPVRLYQRAQFVIEENARVKAMANALCRDDRGRHEQPVRGVVCGSARPV